MKTKKKQCTKGYSCGVSCISTTKACRKEFTDGVAVLLSSRLPSTLAKLREERNRVWKTGDWNSTDRLVAEMETLLAANPPKLEGNPPLSPTLRKEPSPELIENLKTKWFTFRKDQEEVYEELGFNAKPDLVDSRDDLYRHRGLIRGSDDLPMIFYRGVDDFAYHDELRVGDKHYVGQGVYGNGTYAAGGDRQSQELGAVYTASQFGRAKVVFGIKADANVFRGDLKQEVERVAETLGLNPLNVDTGIIMALGGYDAYMATKEFTNVSEWDKGLTYYVVLNRSAMVISRENITEL